MSAPLGILGVEYPDKVHSIMAWFKVFRAAKKRINAPTDVDVIVQELGTDRIGEIPHFGTYLQPDIGVVSAVSPEHMEFFGTLEAVAQEELAAANFSKLAIINRDDIDGKFATYLTNAAVDTYGTTSAAEYRFETQDFSVKDGYTGMLIAPEFPKAFPATIHVVGEHNLRPVIAAMTVAVKLGMASGAITQGVAKVRPVPGRMNPLRGLKDSILLDDTYNSSPAAAAAALQTLYMMQAPQRIAILGDMNELGDSSIQEHEKLGDLCDPSLLTWVVTIGRQTEQYLAPRAKARGCQVMSFASALDAGAFVHKVLEDKAVVLAKGSQGDIYTEEALKMLLHETHEDHELVRQSPKWLEEKNKFFSKI